MMKNIIKLLTIGVLTSTTTMTVIACAAPVVKAEKDISTINHNINLGQLSFDTAKDFLQKLNEKLKSIKGFENITPNDYYVDNADTKSSITDKEVVSSNKLKIILSAKSSAFTGVTGIINVIYIRSLTQQDTIYVDKNGLKKTTSEQDLSSLETEKILQIGFYKSNDEIKAVKMPFSIVELPNELPREITSLASMFADNEKFNADLVKWDTSNVRNMSGMFYNARDFNGDISTWDTSKVTNMSGMFYENNHFNRDISKWNTSQVTDMSQMFGGFFGNHRFDQDLSKWDVSNVTNMGEMFYHATSFNQDLSKWDVSNVTNMGRMFMGASSFNQDLSNWNVAKVTEHDNFEANSGITSASKLPKWKTKF